MDNKYFSRKFVLTLLLTVIVVGNYWFVAKEPLPWEAILALAGFFGVYAGANAYESARNEPTYHVNYNESAWNDSPALEPQEEVTE